MVDRRASVHDDQQPGVGGELGGLLVPDVELHPDRPGTDLNRLLDMGQDELGINLQQPLWEGGVILLAVAAGASRIFTVRNRLDMMR